MDHLRALAGDSLAAQALKLVQRAAYQTILVDAVHIADVRLLGGVRYIPAQSVKYRLYRGSQCCCRAARLPQVKSV